MNLTKASIISGNVTIDGFRLDGNYIASEPIPNYLIWEFRGHQEFTTNQCSFVNATGFDCELISLMGGSYDDDNVEVRLGLFRVMFQPQDTPNNYPKNYVFYSSFDTPLLPYSFGRGVIVPNGAQALLQLSEYVAYIRITAVPRLNTLIGNITISP